MPFGAFWSIINYHLRPKGLTWLRNYMWLWRQEYVRMNVGEYVWYSNYPSSRWQAITKENIVWYFVGIRRPSNYFQNELVFWILNLLSFCTLWYDDRLMEGWIQFKLDLIPDNIQGWGGNYSNCYDVEDYEKNCKAVKGKNEKSALELSAVGKGSLKRKSEKSLENMERVS